MTGDLDGLEQILMTVSLAQVKWHTILWNKS